MYQRAEICLPRKKKVRESFHANTYRIFDEKIPDRLDPDDVYKDHKYLARDPGDCDLLKTHNVPQPYHTKFIRTNVRFLNAPISHMETEPTMSEQFKWWSSAPEQSVSCKAPYCRESTQRGDYQPITHTPVTRARDGTDRTTASGIIPTLSPIGHSKELVEHISFIHQYDSRKLHDQPYQGRRHGAFVWRETGPRGRAATFLSTEGSSGANQLNSSQPAPLSPRQMQGSGGAISVQAKGCPEARDPRGQSSSPQPLLKSSVTAGRVGPTPQGRAEGFPSHSGTVAEGSGSRHTDRGGRSDGDATPDMSAVNEGPAARRVRFDATGRQGLASANPDCRPVLAAAV